MTEPAPEQADLVAFLASPTAHQGETPVQIDTHLSHLFLTSHFVLKLKRALRLDFVDYSSPAQRRRYCEREVAANADWAASLYCGVEPVWQTPEGFRIGGQAGDAEPVDWLVRMLRFPDEDRLDKRLQAGGVTIEDIINFADDLATRHNDVATNTAAGGSAAVAALIAQIGGDLHEAGVSACWRDDARRWQDNALATLELNRELCDARARAGRVRPCHGDLHLKNICYWQGRLTGYDALEFDDVLSTIDTLYDAAFPIMDLLRYGAPWAANALLNRYLARTDDYDGLALLDLYLSKRAAVRAMATGFAGKNEDARAYLDLALDLLAPRPEPVLVALGGRSGTGKSLIARAIAPAFGSRPGAIVLRSDMIRKALAGVAPETALPPSEYGAQMSARVYTVLAERARSCLAAGYSCILDATFLSPHAETTIAAAGQDLSVPIKRLWLDAPADVLRSRIKARRKDASDADIAVLERQLHQAGPAGWTHVDVSQSREDAISNVLQHTDVSLHPLTD